MRRINSKSRCPLKIVLLPLNYLFYNRPISNQPRAINISSMVLDRPNGLITCPVVVVFVYKDRDMRVKWFEIFLFLFTFFIFSKLFMTSKRHEAGIR